MAASVELSTKQSASAVTTITTATTLNVVSGRTILIFSNANNSNLNTPSDNVGGNTYTPLGAQQTLAGGQFNRAWIATGVTGTAAMTFTQTANDGGTPDAMSIYVAVLTGIAASPHDQTVVQADSSSPYTSPAASPAQAGSLLVGFHSSESGGGTASHTPGGGFAKHQEETDGNNFFNGCLSSLHVTSTASVNTTLTVTGITVSDSSNWMVIIKDSTTGQTLSVASGSYGLTGVASVLRPGSTTYLRYRK